jgi:hypothetical protein
VDLEEGKDRRPFPDPEVARSLGNLSVESIGVEDLQRNMVFPNGIPCAIDPCVRAFPSQRLDAVALSDLSIDERLDAWQPMASWQVMNSPFSGWLPAFPTAR